MRQLVKQTLSVALTLASIAVIAIHPALATVGQLTSLQQLTAGDESLSYAGTVEGNVDSPLTLTGTTNTLTLTAQNGSTGAFFFQDSDGVSVDPVAFPAGTSTLATSASPLATPSGPLEIDFATGVQAFGLYAQDVASDTETFQLSVFSSLSGVTTINLPPVDNTSNTGTGVFLGAYGTTGDLINKVVVSSSSSQAGGSNDFIFGAVSFGSTVVPESSTLLLVSLTGAAGLAAAYVARRRRASAI